MKYIARCPADTAHGRCSVVIGWPWNTWTTKTLWYPSLSVPVKVEMLLLLGNKRCVILVTVIRLKCFSKCAALSPWDRKFNIYGCHECRSPTDCKDTSQWRCHICICGTRTVEKLTRYRTYVPEIFLVDHPLWVQLFEWLLHQRALDVLRLHSILWVDERVSCVRVCPIVISGRRTYLIRERVYQFNFNVRIWADIVGLLSWVPSAIRQTDGSEF